MTDSTVCQERDRILADLYEKAEDMRNLCNIENDKTLDQVKALLRVAYSLGSLTRAR